ncbi:MAG: hypothetical protein HY200_05990 [Nitrospirae bacterium]|nr:hypothetical protein [Nitrospirota bacterium]
MILTYYPLLIFIAPLIAGLVTLFFGGVLGKKVHQIGAAGQALSLGVSLQHFYKVIAHGPERINLDLFSFAASGIFHFGFYFDRLSSLLMVHITLISTLIYIFSNRYMQQDRNYTWFLSLLSLTTFVLLCMISSSNLLMLFFFWQLLSWFLCLLSYHYSHLPTVRGAFRTFVMQRIGDVAFLMGILLAYELYGTFDFVQLFDRAAQIKTSFSIWPAGGIEMSGATAVTFLIFIGAMSKSAQFPLHMWLPDSLYAPTPVHALLHAGIINAGGFLLNRLAPLYGLSSSTLHFVFATGVLTALLGAGMMLTQNDIKKTLGYSTIGQMGYMIMECGLGAFSLAIFHLIAHGLFKGTTFLNCGHVIHATRQEPRHPLKDNSAGAIEFSFLTWLTGFITTLILPLIILLAAHGVLSLPLRNAQGVVIFLFFSWVTSSQAIMTLYRLQAVASRKVAALMLLTLLLVVLTYLLAAQAFTYFLYPDLGAVVSYFQAAALPAWLFDVIVETTALAVILNWVFIYARSHGQSLHMPAWVRGLEDRAYLFFMNRLYLDALAFKLRTLLSRFFIRLDKTWLFPIVTIFIAAAWLFMFSGKDWLDQITGPEAILFLGTALMVPLFPFQGIYLTVLSRLPGYFSLVFGLLMPLAGMMSLARLVPQMPQSFLDGVETLALFGVFYGSIKALAQNRLNLLLAHAGTAFYAFLWWHWAVTGYLTPQAVVYTCGVTLVIGGLLLADLRLRTRYGSLDLNQLGGLIRPMPRFAVLTVLLVMAGMGLPPFGLFSGYVAMLLEPSVKLGWGLAAALMTWLVPVWYLFRLIQRLLLGPHRTDLVYEDFTPAEFVPLLAIVMVLLVLGLLPYGFFESDSLKYSYQSALELLKWDR